MCYSNVVCFLLFGHVLETRCPLQRVELRPVEQTPNTHFEFRDLERKTENNSNSDSFQEKRKIFRVQIRLQKHRKSFRALNRRKKSRTALRNCDRRTKQQATFRVRNRQKRKRKHSECNEILRKTSKTHRKWHLCSTVTMRNVRYEAHNLHARIF